MCPRSVQLKCPIHAQVCKHVTGECTREPGHSKLREDDESTLSTSRSALFQTSRGPIEDVEWTRVLNAAMKEKDSNWGEEIEAVKLYRRGRRQFKVTGRVEGQDKQWVATHCIDNMKTSKPSTTFGEAQDALVAQVGVAHASTHAPASHLACRGASAAENGTCQCINACVLTWTSRYFPGVEKALQRCRPHATSG